MSKFGSVFTAVKPLFKERGFRKSGNNFYRVDEETITVVNFQGSRSGPGFFVNFGSKPYSAAEGAKPSRNDLRVHSRRVKLFYNAGNWLYDMSEVELAIRLAGLLNASMSPRQRRRDDLVLPCHQ